MVWPIKRFDPEIVAAVDLGSNSFHMIVCRVSKDELIVVDRLREMVRLAAGIDENRNIGEDAQQRALDCLTRFGQRLANIPSSCVRVVGTNTLRSARNSSDFMSAAEQQLGHPIEVISGTEEARLIYLGVTHSLATNQNKRLVIDIGGGSTEFIIGEGFKPQRLESLHIGCVSMSQRFFSSGRIDHLSLLQAELAVMQELEPIIQRYQRPNWLDAIGASGTIRAIDRIVHKMEWADNGITLKSLEKLIEAMRSAGHIDQLELKGLDDERRPVLCGGVMILYTAFKALQIESMRVADGALREGLIHDLLGRMHHEDVRSQSVTALARRYAMDFKQVQRVQQTLAQCYQQIAAQWGSDETDLQWLEWAACLYEIGLEISHSQYQKHGAYIIKHADLAGFSRQEQLFLSTLVLAHRRKFPQKELKALPRYWQKRAIRFAILLRLAIALHRSRTDSQLPAFTLSVSDNELTMVFPAGWLAEHQLTEADLKQEALYLQKIDFTLTISEHLN